MIAPGPMRPRPAWREWLWFVGTLALIEIVDAGSDIVRGNLFPPDPAQAIEHARQVVQFEAEHGFFVEPDLYTFFQHTHHVFAFELTPGLTVGIANNVYAFFHFGVPLLVLGWIFVRHRIWFGLLRNVIVLTGLLTLAVYMLYPVAPPRLTTGIVWHHAAFQFHNTMPYPKGAFELNGRPVGYNPDTAMPSLHIAWATIMATTLVLLARNPLIRIFALAYLGIMVLTVVVTANHYLLDGVGSLIVVGEAAPLALAFRWLGLRFS